MPDIKMFVYSNALEDQDEVFNRWYSEVHLPDILRYTKCKGAQRFRLSEVQPASSASTEFKYLAIYDFDVDSLEAYDSLLENFDKTPLDASMDTSRMRTVFYDALGEKISG